MRPPANPNNAAITDTLAGRKGHPVIDTRKAIRARGRRHPSIRVRSGAKAFKVGRLAVLVGGSQKSGCGKVRDNRGRGSKNHRHNPGAIAGSRVFGNAQRVPAVAPAAGIRRRVRILRPLPHRIYQPRKLREISHSPVDGELAPGLTGAQKRILNRLLTALEWFDLISRFNHLQSCGYSMRRAASNLHKSPSWFSGRNSPVNRFNREGFTALLPRIRKTGVRPFPTTLGGSRRLDVGASEAQGATLTPSKTS